MRRCVPLCALVLCLLCAHGRLGAQERPSRPPLTAAVIKENLRTDWFGAYLKGQKLGYVSTAMTRLAGTEPAYLVTTRLEIHTVSAGEKLDLHATEKLEFEGKPPYALRRASTSHTQGQGRQKITMERTANGFRVTTETDVDRTVKEIPPIDYTLADALASYVWLRGRPAVGATLLTQDLDVGELRLNLERRKMLGARTALVKGVKVTYYEVESTNLRDKITTLERYDDKGNLLSGHIGDAFEIRLESEEQAKDIKAAADLFVLGLVKIDRPLGNPLTVTGLVVEVMGKHAGFLESGPSQTVTRNPSGTYTCKIGKQYGKEARATAEEIKDGLAATVTYPATHPRVQALARKAVGDAATPEEKVRRLVRFVHDYIRPSYRGKGMIVLDLLEKKEGDCTAYAALFTTLARAAGIPAREVSGLLYIGDDQKAFGGHAWNEVVLGGRWVPVDASCGETQIDATHISCGSDSRGGTNMLRIFGDLSLHLVEVLHKR
jgi:hypothetical protein